MGHGRRRWCRSMSDTRSRAGAPLWLRAVQRLERAIGEPAESVLHSDTYFDLVAQATRARARAGRAAETLSRRCLHLLNLPAGSDVRRVREQLSRMERRLAQVSKELDELTELDELERGDESSAAATANPKSPPSSPLMPPRLSPSDLVARVNRDVERTLLRARNGIRYVRGSSRPPVGATPKETVWQRGKAQLWRYRGGPARYNPPLLIVHSLVSRSYILDLAATVPSSSFSMPGSTCSCSTGACPTSSTRTTALPHTSTSTCRAPSRWCARDRLPEVTMAGDRLGGVLAMLYASGREDATVRNLILMATPVNFDEMGPMVAGLREGRLNPEDLIDHTGNVPADVLYSGFYMLAPTTTIAQHATLLENLWNDEFVEGYQAMAQWARDHVPFPGAAFREVVEQLIRANALMSGSMRIGGRTIRLATHGPAS